MQKGYCFWIWLIHIKSSFNKFYRKKLYILPIFHYKNFVQILFFCTQGPDQISDWKWKHYSPFTLLNEPYWVALTMSKLLQSNSREGSGFGTGSWKMADWSVWSSTHPPYLTVDPALQDPFVWIKNKYRYKNIRYRRVRAGIPILTQNKRSGDWNEMQLSWFIGQICLYSLDKEQL